VAELLANEPLWIALAATLAAQIVKILIVAATERRFAPERLLETGGMPSSHSAAVTGRVLGMERSKMWSSPCFCTSR